MDASIYLATLVAGVASHLLFFNRYECHMYGVPLLFAFIIWTLTTPVVLDSVYGFSLSSAILAVVLLNTSFLTGAFGSTLAYRLFLNPLNKFPGPFGARISSLYWSAQLGKSDAYHKLHALHNKYGKIVRVGSNDLSIIDPEAATQTYAPDTKVTKAPWYDMEIPYMSMHTCRNKPLHDKRRRVWAPAFSDKALRGYEEMIHEYNDKLVRQIEKTDGKPMNCTHWFNVYSFDVMGSLAFGRKYNMLDTGKKTYELDMLNEGMEPLAQMLPTWLMRMLLMLPGTVPGYKKFLKFCIDELTWRVQNDSSRTGKITDRPQVGSDVLTWILSAYRDDKYPEREPMLQADTKLVIVAGSDTTAATLTYMTYHLAQHPEIVDKIRTELKPLCEGDWTDQSIKHCKYLNGAINEALRLHPPVPSGLRRMVPPDGMMLGETFIPGGTEFFMPQFAMARDSSIYVDPEKFEPERWFNKPEMVKHNAAFAPFSLGPFGCIGKNLALMELRTLTARLLLKFNLALAPGEDGHRLLYETRDHFTLALGDLDVVFTPVNAGK